MKMDSPSLVLVFDVGVRFLYRESTFLPVVSADLWKHLNTTSFYLGRKNEMSASEKLETALQERDKLLSECQQLLTKIANHRYSLKLLISAKNALSIIADYKSPRN
jgi:hypothetical protein